MSEIEKITGLHEHNLRNVLKLSKISRQQERVVVYADTVKDALAIAGEGACFAKKISAGKFIVQKKSFYGIVDDINTSVFRFPVNKSEYEDKFQKMLNFRTVFGIPKFQENFLINGLRLAFARLDKDLPKDLFSVDETIDHIKKEL